MAKIQSATGPLETTDLGTTLMHEHIIVRTRTLGLWENWPQLFDRSNAVSQATDLLAEAKGHGIDTLVDLTTTDLGRDISFVAEVAQRSGMNVIVATGMWWRPPAWFDDAPVDQIAALFIKDITEGIAGTGVRAGIIKVATDEPGVTPAIENILRAAARAHRATGVPISTHAHAGLKRGLEQQNILKEEGVDLSRVVIGHCGDTEDTGYLKQVIGAGSTIGMDRFGFDVVLDTAPRVATVALLASEGLAGKMVLSHDVNCVNDFPAALLRRLPRWRFTLIPDEIVPALRSAGVTQAQIDQMLIHNPREIFSRQGAY